MVLHACGDRFGLGLGGFQFLVGGLEFACSDRDALLESQAMLFEFIVPRLGLVEHAVEVEDKLAQFITCCAAGAQRVVLGRRDLPRKLGKPQQRFADDALHLCSQHEGNHQ